ncbi:hypothetical protein DEFR109230_16460 [Deinococcus frigens]
MLLRRKIGGIYGFQGRQHARIIPGLRRALPEHLAPRRAVIAFPQEIGGQDQALQHGQRHPGPARDGHVQRQIDHQIHLGVQIPARLGGPSGGAGQLAVQVVQHGLELQQQRGCEAALPPRPAAPDQPRCVHAQRRVEQHHMDGVHVQPGQRVHQLLRQRAIETFVQQFVGRPFLAGLLQNGRPVFCAYRRPPYLGGPFLTPA